MSPENDQHIIYTPESLRGMPEKLPINVSQIDHSFPFPSEYSRMRLLALSDVDGSVTKVVEKTYGMKAGEKGHAMEMNRDQADAMGDLVLQYVNQLNVIGITVATVYQTKSVPIDESNPRSLIIRWWLQRPKSAGA